MSHTPPNPAPTAPPDYSYFAEDASPPKKSRLRQCLPIGAFFTIFVGVMVAVCALGNVRVPAPPCSVVKPYIGFR